MDKPSFQFVAEQKAEINAKIGSLTALLTETKSDIVGAVNELFTSVGNGKSAVASAITGKGVPTAADATFQQMAENIGRIPTGTTPTDHVYSTFRVSSQISTTPTKVFTLPDFAVSHKNDSNFTIAIWSKTASVANNVVGGMVGNRLIISNTYSTYGGCFYANSTGKIASVSASTPVNQPGTDSIAFWLNSEDNGIYFHTTTTTYKWPSGDYYIFIAW